MSRGVAALASVLVLAILAPASFAEPIADGAKKRSCAKKKAKRAKKRCKRKRQASKKPAQATTQAQAPAPAPSGTEASRYSGRFVHGVHSATFGQAPTWSADGTRVAHQAKVDGVWQVHTANRDGSGSVCVTCGQPGPNMVASIRPQGDKILFHSWRGKALTIGAPGFGGVGSELYVVNPDGSNPVRLSDGPELSEGDSTGEGEDHYHAYFSPDGQQISWTHLDCNVVTQDGRCMMRILLADYVDDGNGDPQLENVRVARPENGHYYETQLWAPDGSGFLFTESVDNSLNLELFFYRVSDGQITRLTDNPAWDEQATFTPDMSKIIFMSSRDHPGFFNSYRNIADALGLGSETDFLTILPMFELGFLQPVAQESTDLYELDLATNAVRRLTYSGDDGWVIPEIMWDPNSGELIWTEARFPDGLRMQLPIELVRDLTELLTYALGGGLPIPDPTHPGALEVFNLERRTQLGHYEP